MHKSNQWERKDGGNTHESEVRIVVSVVELEAARSGAHRPASAVLATKGRRRSESLISEYVNLKQFGSNNGNLRTIRIENMVKST